MTPKKKSPRAFVVRRRHTNIDEYISTSSEWNLEISQLTSGQYYCETHVISFSHHRYTFFKHNLQMMYRGSNAGNGFILCIPLIHQNLPIYLDHLVEQTAISCVPAGEQIKVITRDSFEAVTFFLSSDHWTKNLDGSIHWPSQSGTSLFIPTSEQLQQLRELLLSIRQQYTRQQILNRNDENALLDITEHEVIPLLLRIMSNKVDRPVRPRPERFQAALRLILDNLDSSPNIFQLSSELGISQRNLQYMFKHHIGMSPKQFIKLYRLNNARRLLWHADRQRGKISDIANQLGYWHMGSFAQDFKRLFLKSPSDILSAESVDTTKSENLPNF